MHSRDAFRINTFRDEIGWCARAPVVISDAPESPDGESINIGKRHGGAFYPPAVHVAAKRRNAPLHVGASKVFPEQREIDCPEYTKPEGHKKVCLGGSN
jgi:hypothetical protein